MLSSGGSCSDCKIELIERRWTKVLLKWINNCVYDNGEAKRLSAKCLSDIMTKYKGDVCINDMDRAMLCTDDMEPFIRYKYPILRLRCISEDRDIPKKVYVMTSILLYHCCMTSQTGLVDADIIKHLSKFEQEVVLKFCENLYDMETTVNNVMMAIQGAFKTVSKTAVDLMPGTSLNNIETSKSSCAHMSAASTIKTSVSTLPSDPSNAATNKEPTVKFPALKFTSSVTVLPSVVTDTSTYSESKPETDNHVEKWLMSEPKCSMDSIESVSLRPVPRRDLSDLNFVPRSPKDFDRKKDYDKEHLTGLKKNPTKKEPVQKYLKKETGFMKEAGVSKEKGFLKERVFMTDVILQHEKAVNQDVDISTPPADNNVNQDCKTKCLCTKCKTEDTIPSCGEPGGNTEECDNEKPSKSALTKFPKEISIIAYKKQLLIAIGGIITLIIVFSIVTATTLSMRENKKLIEGKPLQIQKLVLMNPIYSYQDKWKCKNKLCQKAYEHAFEEIYPSHSTCSLKCTGPHIWPLPTGTTQYSNEVVNLATDKLEYKLKTVPSDSLRQYLAEAFKLFIGDLAKMEQTGFKYRNKSQYLDVKKMNIVINVETDPEPRLRLNTVENYTLNLETDKSHVLVKISSPSFCGVRHGLETLNQMILLDQSTGYLVTVSSALIKDSPSFEYRGLMIDTGRNYIPVPDLMRTIDSMATVKLNTFHWRISDVTSFPLLLPKLPQLVEYGAYDRSMVYTKDHVKTIVKRAGIRGIRVLIEVAAPGPVGRPWSWSRGATCSSNKNDTCGNVLCLKLQPQDYVLNTLELIYSEILEMTQVDDVFHLSQGTFSLDHCFDLMSNRDGFLDIVLNRLKLANKGFLPKLPIIWHTSQLNKDSEARTWERFGVQLNEWKQDSSDDLSKFKLIHSSKWDLSCEMKNSRCKRYRNWQEMYSWKSWKNVKAFTVEGGEALLWTDLVNSGNLDYHLWPRLAAVAERLWSDIAINKTAGGSVYVRLNSFRSRLRRDDIAVQPIWPAWCIDNPEHCLLKIR